MSATDENPLAAKCSARSSTQRAAIAVAAVVAAVAIFSPATRSPVDPAASS